MTYFGWLDVILPVCGGFYAMERTAPGENEPQCQPAEPRHVRGTFGCSKVAFGAARAAMYAGAAGVGKPHI